MARLVLVLFIALALSGCADKDTPDPAQGPIADAEPDNGPVIDGLRDYGLINGTHVTEDALGVIFERCSTTALYVALDDTVLDTLPAGLTASMMPDTETHVAAIVYGAICTNVVYNLTDLGPLEFSIIGIPVIGPMGDGVYAPEIQFNSTGAWLGDLEKISTPLSNGTTDINTNIEGVSPAKKISACEGFATGVAHVSWLNVPCNPVPLTSGGLDVGDYVYDESGEATLRMEGLGRWTFEFATINSNTVVSTNGQGVFAHEILPNYATVMEGSIASMYFTPA